MTHRQVDSIIKRSDRAAEVDKMTRKVLKSLLLLFEKNGGDAAKAIQKETIRQQCNLVALEHYRRSLISKGFSGFIKSMIDDGKMDAQKYYKSKIEVKN